MKNNNNNNNIIILESYGYVYDANTKMVHPMYKRGGWDTSDEESIYDFIERVTMDGERFNEEEGERIIMLGDIDVNFTLWVHDGNVCEIEKGVFTTQDTCWSHRFNGLGQLKEYFVKQFCDEQVRLKWDIEYSGKWLQVSWDLYINKESGEFSNGEEIYETHIGDDNAREYFEQLDAVTLETIAIYFPKAIKRYQDIYLRSLCTEIKWRIEEGDYGIAITLVEQISAMTRG